MAQNEEDATDDDAYISEDKDTEDRNKIPRLDGLRIKEAMFHKLRQHSDLSSIPEDVMLSMKDFLRPDPA